MKVVWFERSRVQRKYSIEKVFDTIKPIMSYSCELSVRSVREYKVSLLSILKNVWFAYRYGSKKQINHVLGDVHYLVFGLGKKSVLTVHDLNLIHKNTGLKKAIACLFWYYLPFKYCRVITVISEKTKLEILRYYPFCKNKLHVIGNPLPKSSRFKPLNFNSSRPKILFIGTTENKNLKRAICALTEITSELIIVGALSKELTLALTDARITYRQYVHLTQSEIDDLYIESDIVLFPSLYEGFGMPVIEAQQMGRPVVCSEIEPMLSVAGEHGAVFVDPYCPDSIKEGLLSVINDRDIRTAIISAGFENCKKYDPQIIANQYIEIYKKLT